MRVRWVALIAAFAGLTALPWTPAWAETVTVRADEWCPFNCAPEADKPGYGIEIAREIFGKAGHTVDYSTLAWARALEDCKKGAISSVLGTYPDESPDFVYPAEQIGSSDNTFVVKRGNPWRYQGPASLEKLRIGVIQGYVYSGEVGSYIDEKSKSSKRASVFPVGGDNGLEQNLRKLVAGRIDATVESLAVLTTKLAALNLADKIEYAGTVDSLPIYLAFCPGVPASKDYAALYDKGVAEMRTSGRLKQILDRYGIKDWK